MTLYCCRYVRCRANHRNFRGKTTSTCKQYPQKKTLKKGIHYEIILLLNIYQNPSESSSDLFLKLTELTPTSGRESPAVFLGPASLDEEEFGFLVVPLDLREGLDQVQAPVDVALLHCEVSLVSMAHEPHHQTEGKDRSDFSSRG